MTEVLQAVGKVRGSMFFCWCHCFRYTLIMVKADGLSSASSSLFDVKSILRCA